MKIFITGATGLIGIPLTLRLAEAGHVVHALYRTQSRAEPLKHLNVILFQGHVLDGKSLKEAMSGCDAVIHLAAYARVWSKDPETYHRINVDGTRNVMDVALDLKIRKVILTSTAGVFGPGLSIDESTVRSCNFFNEYERTKSGSDMLALEYAGKGMEVVIVHPTRVFGPGLMNESNSVTRMIKEYVSGKWHIIPGNGERIGNYVYIDDVVKGHILALEKGKNGERYILGGENVSYNQFFDILRKVSGKRYTLYRLPLFVMLSASGLMVFMARVFNIEPLITPGFVRRYNHDWSLTSRKAMEENGYVVTPLEEGIRKTLEWFNEY